MNNIINLRPKPVRAVPECMDVPEVAYALNVSTYMVYKMLNDKQLPSIRCGKRWLVPREEFHRWLTAKTVSV